MAIPARLSLVTLGVSDVEAATQFYEALGWKRSSASAAGEVTFFDTAGGLLGLWSRASLAGDAKLPDGELPPYRGVALAINLGSAEEVDAALADAFNAGGTVLKPAEATDWGGYSGYFADPDGYAWEVAHNPFWPLGPDGLPQLP
jgi:predicted lactoylglutathione lyase